MNIEDKLKEELHLHTLAMKEQEKLEARLLGKSDYFNRIVEMNTEAERRKIAAQIMASMMQTLNGAINTATSHLCRSVPPTL